MFERAIEAINSDGIICYPTEGVWGLGCHPQSEVAFRRLLAVKNRAADKGVILLAGDINQLSPYIVIDDATKQAFARYRGQFVTLILPKADSCPDYLSGGRNSIAVRLTYYPPLKALCLAAGTALVSTSANISGEAPVATIEQAKAVFSHRLDDYVDFPLGGQTKPSQIIKIYNGKAEVIRE